MAESEHSYSRKKDQDIARNDWVKIQQEKHHILQIHVWHLGLVIKSSWAPRDVGSLTSLILLLKHTQPLSLALRSVDSSLWLTFWSWHLQCPGSSTDT